MTMTTAWPGDEVAGSPGGGYIGDVVAPHGPSPHRSAGDMKRSRSISELHRQHSSFGDVGGKPQPHPIFNGMSVLDSPTASATTFSSSGSHFGSSGKGSPTTPFTPASKASPAGSNVGGAPQSSGESPNSSASSCSSRGSAIDHTALLLGLQDEFAEEESSDDEVEWNSTFSPRASLDELEGNFGDTDTAGLRTKEDTDNALGRQLQSAISKEEGGDDDGVGRNDGLQLDFSSATAGDMPVTYNLDDDLDLTPQQSNGKAFHMRHLKPKLPDWDEEDHYGVRKNLHSMEHKCKHATMRAKAMKEKASSALSQKAHMAKEKVADIKLPGVPLKVRRAPPQHQPNGMEIIADDKLEVMSQVSEVSKQFEAGGSARASPKRTLFKSRLSSKVSTVSARSKQTGKSAASHVGSRLSAVSSIKEKASSALIQKAHMAKEKTVGAMLATSAPLVRQQSRGAIRTRQRLALPPHVKREVESLPSDDETSEVPSMFNSEGPSIDNESARLALSPSAFGLSPGAFGAAPKPQSMFATPKVTRKGSLGVIGNIHLDETMQRGNLTVGGEDFRTLVGSPISPPQLAQCPEESSQASCIDENGFLLSPSASVASTEALRASSVASGGGGEPFDPNSFLFLSPLSHHDADDPDYGLPDLLSRSHGHNSAAAESARPGPPQAGKAASGRPKLLPRLPPSPRKKLLKKMKGGNGASKQNNAANQGIGTKEVMGRHLRPQADSHRRLRSSMF